MTSEEILVTATEGGRPITLDPIRTVVAQLEIREVESTIPCGFQVNWGEGEWGDEPVELNVGAGFGSRWGTLTYKGKRYAFKADDLIGAFLKAIGEA